MRRVAILIVALSLAYVPLGGQRAAIPRTPEGRPDLQGTWNAATITPLERSAEFATKPTLTEAEAHVWAQQFLESNSLDRRDGGPARDRSRAYPNRFRGSTERMRVVERFTRVDATTLLYRFTVDDPATWTRPWTGEYPWVLSEEPLYEYACHEGNYSFGGILRGARLLEQEAAKSQR